MVKMLILMAIGALFGATTVMILACVAIGRNEERDNFDGKDK